MGMLGVMMYGLMGLDGLGHYWLALCVEHTFAMNATIWAEAATGVALAAMCAVFMVRRARS